MSGWLPTAPAADHGVKKIADIRNCVAKIQSIIYGSQMPKKSQVKWVAKKPKSPAMTKRAPGEGMINKCLTTDTHIGNKKTPLRQITCS